MNGVHTHDANYARLKSHAVWQKGRYGHPFRTCGYCGCIHPEDLAKTQNWYASWADRKYGWPHKFYVENLVNPEPDKLFIIGSSNGNEAPGHAGDATWVRYADMTDDQAEVALAEGYGPISLLGSIKGKKNPDWLLFGHRPTLFAKFYTEHLADTEIEDDVKDLIMRRSDLWINFNADGSDGLRWQRYSVKFRDKLPPHAERIASCDVSEFHTWPREFCTVCGWSTDDLDPEAKKNWGPPELRRLKEDDD
jgi:hypothetical protein